MTNMLCIVGTSIIEWNGWVVIYSSLEIIDIDKLYNN